MNFPEFTAEDSLYNTSGHHIHPVPTRFGTYQAGNVMPQTPSSGGSVFCHARGCHCNSDEVATTCLVNQVYVEPMRLVTNTVAVAPFKPRLKMVGGKLK